METIEELVQRIKKASKGIKERVWKELTTLIIDEVSMLNPVLFDKLEKIARIKEDLIYLLVVFN